MLKHRIDVLVSLCNGHTSIFGSVRLRLVDRRRYFVDGKSPSETSWPHLGPEVGEVHASNVNTAFLELVPQFHYCGGLASPSHVDRRCHAPDSFLDGACLISRPRKHSPFQLAVFLDVGYAEETSTMVWPRLPCPESPTRRFSHDLGVDVWCFPALLLGLSSSER